jgi:hypothetical protein
MVCVRLRAVSLVVSGVLVLAVQPVEADRVTDRVCYATAQQVKADMKAWDKQTKQAVRKGQTSLEYYRSAYRQRNQYMNYYHNELLKATSATDCDTLWQEYQSKVDAIPTP